MPQPAAIPPEENETLGGRLDGLIVVAQIWVICASAEAGGQAEIAVYCVGPAMPALTRAAGQRGSRQQARQRQRQPVRRDLAPTCWTATAVPTVKGWRSRVLADARGRAFDLSR